VLPSSGSSSAGQSEKELLTLDIESLQTKGGSSSTNMIVAVSAAQTIDGSTGLTPESELSAEIIAGVRASGRAEQDREESFDMLSLDFTEYSHRLAGFNSALIKLVYSHIKYTRRAVRHDIQGALELDITLLADGSLIQVAMAESSGYSILDVVAVEAAQKALNSALLGELDPVAIAQYSNGGSLVIPVQVNFILQ
jgi:TonB family protein